MIGLLLKNIQFPMFEPSYIMYISPRFLCRPMAFCSTSWSRGTSEHSPFIRKTADLPLQLRVGTFPHFVPIRFYFLSKPLNKSLHQSFLYSFITILHSQSGVTLDYCMIFPYTLSFRHFTFTFEPTNVMSRY